jgi:hypothetical protein
MSFFEFRQNYSGKGFVSNENLDEVVVIEAATSEDANIKAESIGVYFGIDVDIDCPCCHERWVEVSHEDAFEAGSPKAHEVFSQDGTIVYYADGTIVRIGV